MKIRPGGAQLFRADVTKLILAFRNLANAPNTSPETQWAHDRISIPPGIVGSVGGLVDRQRLTETSQASKLR